MTTGLTTAATPPRAEGVGATSPGRRPRSWIAFFAFGAAAAPLLAYAGRLVLHQPSMFFGNDVALLELATREAAHGVRWLGPYSRFGWHHPGPAWFLLLAGPYEALGAHSWSLLVAVTTFHAAAIAGLVHVAWRQGGRHLVLLLAVLVLVYMQAAGLPLFIYPWNPWALILPLCLLIVLGASNFGAPGPRLLWMATIGSVLIQTHIGTAPTVIVVLGTATALALLGDAKERTGGRKRLRGWPPPRPAVLLPAVLLAVLWLPPLIEQTTHGTGNLGLILSFFRDGSPGHGVGDAVGNVGSQLRRLPFERGRAVNEPVPMHPTDGLVFGVYTVLALVLAFAGQRKRDRFARRLGVLTLAALGAAVISVTRITGEVLDFLVAWVSVLPLPLWLGVAHLVFTSGDTPVPPGTSGNTPVPLFTSGDTPVPPGTRWPLIRSGRAAGVALVVGVIPLGLVVARPVTRGPLGTPDVAEVRDAWPVVEAGLGRHRRPVLIRLASQNRWAVATGLTLQLTKAGWDVNVTDDRLFMFSDRQRRSGREQAELVLADERDPAAEPSGGRLLGVVDGTRIELSTPPR